MTNLPSNETLEQEPVVLVARGELNQQDRSLVEAILGRFGLSTSFEPMRIDFDSTPDSIESPVLEREVDSRFGYRFRDIKSKNDILVREHFEDFVDSTTGKYLKRHGAQAFHQLVDGDAPQQRHTNAKELLFEHLPRSTRGKKWQQIREPIPLLGIKLVKRVDCGFTAYQKTLTDRDAAVMSEYGIVAGSLLRGVHIASGSNLGGKRTAEILRAISKQLTEQIHTD